MTEAVRSIMQTDIQRMLENPNIVVVLPTMSLRPQPWNRIQELAANSTGSNSKHIPAHSRQQVRSENAITSPHSDLHTPRHPWAATRSSEPVGPLVTQTYDISGIAGLPETIQKLNFRMDRIETTAAASQNKIETQLTTMANLLTSLSQSVQSLVAATAPPRDGNS